MLAFDPADRPSAAEALTLPYLDAACSGDAPLAPAAPPWTLEALARAGTPVVEGPRLYADDCELDPEQFA